MNDDLDLRLLKYQHKAIMAKRKINNKVVNHEALMPLFKYVSFNTNVNVISEMNKEFVMQLMFKSNIDYNVNNVDDISSSSIIHQLDTLIYFIQRKL